MVQDTCICTGNVCYYSKRSLYIIIYSNIRDKRVEIIYTTNVFKVKNQMDEVNKLYKQIKQNFEWIISVDVDEFITTKKNIKNTIRDELLTVFNNFDCICIPWVMMSCNGKKENPKSILLENTFRWNHDNKHVNSIADSKIEMGSASGSRTMLHFVALIATRELEPRRPTRG